MAATTLFVIHDMPHTSLFPNDIGFISKKYIFLDKYLL